MFTLPPLLYAEQKQTIFNFEKSFRFYSPLKALHYRPQCGQGYVFTRVCDSVHGGSASEHAGIPPPPRKVAPPWEGSTPWDGSTPWGGSTIPGRKHPLPPRSKQASPPQKEEPPMEARTPPEGSTPPPAYGQ